MKRFLVSSLLGVIVLVVVAVAGAQQARAEASTSANVAYVSKYIWRGQDLGLPDDEPCIQPGLNVAFGGGWGFGLWGSYTLDSTDQLDELDYTISYGGSVSERLSYSAGITYYTFPSAGDSSETAEGFAGLQFPKVMLAPKLTVYGDWEEGQGVYVFLSGSHSFPIENAPSLDLALGLGYSDGPWNTEPGISDIDIGLSMTFKGPKTGITFTPSLNYVITPSDNANTEDEFWAGLNIGFSL